MYKRLIILSLVILSALCGLVWLGFRSIQIRAQGLEGVRLGEFAAVAEQIRRDIKRKLDEFMQTEQNRPYTDYLYSYVPENVVSTQQQLPLLRSPLAGRLDHGLAYGNFQIEPDGNITTPNDDIRQGGLDIDNELYASVISNGLNVKNNLLPLLSRKIRSSDNTDYYRETEASPVTKMKVADRIELPANEDLKKKNEENGSGRGRSSKALSIESLQEQAQKTQVMPQRRSIVEQNIFSNTASGSGRALASKENQADIQFRDQSEPPLGQEAQLSIGRQPPEQERQNDIVQVRIGPFETIVTGGDNAEEFVFDGQVFLVRHVQIENRNFWQGFQLNENKLIEEVKDSASKFVREGMSFEVAPTKTKDAVNAAKENGDIAYTAVLDFIFGDLVLSLKETNPDRISKQISHLRNWYLSIIAVVLLAVTLGLAGLWRSARAQIRLAEKKDDFISAVSHELRTPLTSIRMYTEMLEKNWVKSEDKLTEYYKNMRQESERLSRLIENVLDFSRIQRGRKKYHFKIGDINKCIEDVIKMMKPYASQRGFSIQTELGRDGKIAFDCDAVTQIVVNLIDNAVKYAHDAEDKTITIRTRADKQYIVIEVEDRGPGVPHHQRKKIFEQFYRSEAESTRDTTGTGLGLALVKKFTEAHNGFVEIVSAKPTGAIFRVALAVRE